MTSFPTGIIAFTAHFCIFTGTIDLRHLPLSLQDVCITNNKVSGLIGVINLPESLQSLHIGELEIVHKKIYIGKPPDGLVDVCFSGCDFTDVTYANDSDSARIRL